MSITPLAFIFDMDGVIIDSTSVHTEAWRRYLVRHGIDLTGIEMRMLGKRNDEIVRDFFGHKPLTEEDVFRFGAEKEMLFRDLIRPDFESRMVPGIREFLNRHTHVPIGLATNAEPPNVDFILDSAGIRHFFRAIVNGHQVARPKPFPDIYLRVAEMLETPPVNCVVFEDSATGAEAAHAAGMRVVGLTTTLPDLPKTDFLIPNFRDPGIEPWLRSVGLAS